MHENIGHRGDQHLKDQYAPWLVAVRHPGGCISVILELPDSPEVLERSELLRQIRIELQRAESEVLPDEIMAIEGATHLGILGWMSDSDQLLVTYLSSPESTEGQEVIVPVHQILPLTQTEDLRRIGQSITGHPTGQTVITSLTVEYMGPKPANFYEGIRMPERQIWRFGQM